MSTKHRHAVVSSCKSPGPTNLLSCTLACGHTVAANPMRRAGDPIPRPPRTVTCWRCAKDAAAAKTTEAAS